MTSHVEEGALLPEPSFEGASGDALSQKRKKAEQMIQLIVEERLLSSFPIKKGVRREAVAIDERRILELVQKHAGPEGTLSQIHIQQALSALQVKIDTLTVRPPIIRKHARAQSGGEKESKRARRDEEEKIEFPARDVSLLDRARKRVDELEAVEAAAGEGRESRASLPTVKALVQKYKERPFGIQRFHCSKIAEDHRIVCVLASDEERREDERQFLEIVNQHNTQFQMLSEEVGRAHGIGYIDKKHFPDGTLIFVRADLHSDVRSLLAQLEMLKNQGFLDKNYRCVPPFCMMFLGDYSDRGSNDVEVLSLLLKLKMENPESVYLIRGNHEDIAIHERYSGRASFFHEHAEEISHCYDTMPLAMLVSSQSQVKRLGREARREFVHFSHGLFSLSHDLGPFMDDGKQAHYIIPSKPVMSVRQLFRSRKAREAYDRVRAIQAQFSISSSPSGFAWNDVGERTEESKRGAFALSKEDVVHALRDMSSTDAKIVACMRGHQHQFWEGVVPGKHGPKVVATTLPVAQSGNIYRDVEGFASQHTQGVLITIASRVGKWTKRAVVGEHTEAGELTYSVQRKAVSFLAPLVRPASS